MLTPHEAYSRIVLPCIKMLVARRLVRGHGFSENRVARILNVTQAMVSKYMSGNPQRCIEKLGELGISRQRLEPLVEALATELTSGQELAALIRLSVLFEELVASGAICRAYRGAQARALCLRYSAAYSPCLRDIHAEKYRREVARLLTTRGVDEIVPEVGLNIAYAPPFARTPEEVIGLSSRIYRGRHIAPAPRYGGSRHLARILMELRGTGYVAAAAIRLSAHTRGAAHEIYGCLEEAGPASSLEEAERQVVEAAGRCGAVAHVGGYGLEPVLYLFDSSIEGLVAKLVEITVRAGWTRSA